MSNYVLFECLVSLGMLAFIWCYLFNRLRRDNFRSDIRRLRDDLFDFMWQLGYNYDDPGYRRTRQMLNGFLRLSPTVTPTTFVLHFAYVAVREHYGFEAKALPTSDHQGLEAELHRVRRAAVDRLLRFLFLEGILVLLLGAVFLLLNSVRRTRAMVRHSAEEILNWAYVVGSPNLTSTNFNRKVGAA